MSYVCLVDIEISAPTRAWILFFVFFFLPVRHPVTSQHMTCSRSSINIHKMNLRRKLNNLFIRLRSSLVGRAFAKLLLCVQHGRS